MKKISVNILNTEECYMLNKRLTDVFETELKKDFAVTTVMPHLVQLDSDLSVILSKISQTNYTKPLAERDQARDRAFISLRDYCQAFVYDPDSIKSAAAKRLTEFIHKIGWTLYKQGYTEQTASLETLIDALNEPENAKAIIAIDATDRVNTLKTANVAFEETLKLKAEAEARKDVPRLDECKKKILRYLKPLLTYLGLMADVSDNKSYSAVAAEVDEAIEYVMTVAQARHTRRENENTEPEPDENPETSTDAEPSEEPETPTDQSE